MYSEIMQIQPLLYDVCGLRLTATAVVWFRTGRTVFERVMIKAGIIGSTGYAGAELVRLLLQHRTSFQPLQWAGRREPSKYAR